MTAPWNHSTLGINISIMQSIDAAFFDKKFSAQRYMLRYVVGAATEESRQEQFQRVSKFRALADTEIAGVIDQNYTNFNTSLTRFAAISNQLQETRVKVQEISKRAADGKNILSSKTKNLRELLLQKYEAKKVIDIVNDIQYVEAAPAKIHALLSERNFSDAVEMFSNAVDVVFGEKLVAFHAITGVRNALMECKQSIEDQLVLELEHVIYMKVPASLLVICGTFENVVKANQYSLEAIEQELSTDTAMDKEFERLHSLSSQRTAETVNSVSPESSDSYRSSTDNLNRLQAAVDAVKSIHREMEVVGALKSSMDSELREVQIEISLICRTVFNSSSYTSFDNHFTEKKFGKHDRSANFQAFLRLLFHVLRRIAQRHYLVAAYFNGKDGAWSYGMSEVIGKIRALLQRVLSEYMEDNTTSDHNAGAKDPQATVAMDDLFKLSRNKTCCDEDDTALADSSSGKEKAAENTRTRVCEPSVFHLPVVYDDLQQIALDLEQFIRATTDVKTTAFQLVLNHFVASNWIPKIKSKAQQFLNTRYRGGARITRVTIPSDTSYQPPSIDSLLFIAQELSDMIRLMPDHQSELIEVLDSTVIKWLNDCSTIVKGIREPTHNHRHLVQSVSLSELVSIYHPYECYHRAKRGSPIPTPQPKSNPIGGKPPLPSTGAIGLDKLAKTVIHGKEHELEKDYYSPDAWIAGTKGLLMDNARMAILGYINTACDYIAEFLQTVIKAANKRAASSGNTMNGNDPASGPLLVTSMKCSTLADECLLFLRREIRMHCFHFLVQLVSQRFDIQDGPISMAQDAVLSLNINLSSMEHALQPYISSDKIVFLFDDVDTLMADILINNLGLMDGATITKAGVQQMLLNIGALHQGLTGILYSYPAVAHTGYQFERAKRFYQLLLLSETQLELFLLDNRKAYTTAAFKSLWRVETPHRVLSKGSLNKLDSILR